MNSQVNYIIHATLALAFAGCGYIFLQKIYSLSPQANNIESLIVASQDKNIPLSGSAAKGKTIFMNKCASCHNIFKDMTGPGILGFEERGPWANRKNVYEWIRNPSSFMQKSEYAKGLKKKYGVMMTAFPDLTNEEIDAICDYLNQAGQAQYGIPVAERQASSNPAYLLSFRYSLI